MILTGRLPTSFTQTLYNANIDYDSNIPYDGMIVFPMILTGRPTIAVSNSIEIIMTGFWDDSKLWSDTLYWNDNGNRTGTTLVGRTIPA